MTGVAAQIGRFGVVGIIATLVHLAVAWMAARLFGAPPFLANAAGFAAAFACSYLGHFYWTFGQRAGHVARLPRFLIVSGTGFAMTNLVVWLVVKVAEQPFEVALAGILFVVPLTTWLLSRHWAFR